MTLTSQFAESWAGSVSTDYRQQETTIVFQIPIEYPYFFCLVCSTCFEIKRSRVLKFRALYLLFSVRLRGCSLLVVKRPRNTYASVSLGRVCSDNCTCYQTETEVAGQTFYLTQSQYTDTGPTRPSADRIAAGRVATGVPFFLSL